jgi:copper chaperone CopZ
VDKALSKVRGVSESHVCSESKTATVVFNPNRVSSEKLMAVIKSAGFEAKASVN